MKGAAAMARFGESALSLNSPLPERVVVRFSRFGETRTVDRAATRLRHTRKGVGGCPRGTATPERVLAVLVAWRCHTRKGVGGVGCVALPHPKGCWRSLLRPNALKPLRRQPPRERKVGGGANALSLRNLLHTNPELGGLEGVQSFAHNGELLTVKC